MRACISLVVANCINIYIPLRKILHNHRHSFAVVHPMFETTCLKCSVYYPYSMRIYSPVGPIETVTITKFLFVSMLNKFPEMMITHIIHMLSYT